MKKNILSAVVVAAAMLASPVSQAALRTFGLSGVSDTSSDVFNGSITFDTAVAPDVGLNILTGITAFELHFTGSYVADFALADLTSAYWQSISNDFIHAGVSIPWITFSANNGTDQLLAFNWNKQFANGIGYYTNNLTHDVSAVPVPGAVWLMGSGLLGLMGLARKKKLVA